MLLKHGSLSHVVYQQQVLDNYIDARFPFVDWPSIFHRLNQLQILM